MHQGVRQPAWRRFESPQNRGRGFEKFVTAIQRLEASGAKILWNDRINGRQFDVTVRIVLGEETELTVFECRDYSKASVGTSEVEAFVTKARDAGAHKAAMVTPSRFTRGAERVAANHTVALWTLKEFLEECPTRLVEGRTLAFHIRNVVFWSTEGVRYAAPGPDETVLPVTMLEDSQGLRLPFAEGCHRLVVSQIEGIGQYRRFDCRLRGFQVCFPGKPTRQIGGLSFEAGMISVATIRREPGPVNVPHRRRYEYSQPRTGERTSFAEVDLPLGVDTVLTPGRFYRSTMGLTYKCLAIEGDRVNMVLLHLDRLPGDIASIEFTAVLSNGQREYVEIEDRDECRRLEDLVARLGYPGT